MRPLRIAVVADLREEGWPSMDLVSELLVASLNQTPGVSEHVVASELCPKMVRRLTLVPGLRTLPLVRTTDRVTNRYWDYPRWLRARTDDVDLFHIADHSYAHLASVLPAGRTVVTCHDVDAFAGLFDASARRAVPARMMGSRLAEGLQAAARVLCISDATRRAVDAHKLVHADRLATVHLPVHPDFSSGPDPTADHAAERLLGTLDAGVPAILHVGSTIPRKRIDVLLQVVAGVRRHAPRLRLWRVGGALSADQLRMARELGLDGAIVDLPFLDRRTLAAVYRRASVVLQPSDAEGLGLPVLEAMACGTPVVASDVPALREAGGTAATYCRVADLDAWVAATRNILDETTSLSNARLERRAACLRHAQGFSTAGYARQLLAVYRELRPVDRPAALMVGAR